MFSWHGKQDSALVFIARARRSEPADLEARRIEAKIMAWKGRHADALVRYDSVLASTRCSSKPSWDGRAPARGAAT